MPRSRLPQSLAELHRLAAQIEARIKQLQVQRRALLDEVEEVEAEIRRLKGEARAAGKR